MSTATADAGGRALRPARYGSMARDRKRALRWSYFFLILFVIFFLMPPVYMLITSLKTSAEIGGGDEPVVGLPPDAGELHRAADAAVSS